MATIALENVSKQFPDGTIAVRDLDLEVADGEFLVLVGPSGSGKTTALRMVVGLEELTGGQIKIGDRVVNDLPPRSRDIAMVFQNYALYPHMSVFDNMAFALKLRKSTKPDIHKRVDNTSGMLGIQNFLQRKPKKLSGGQRQRVAMGRAIVRRPAAFLMDEPLSNLDAKLRVQMRTEIQQLHQQLETTTMYVTHDQIEAMTMADRVAVMRDGVLQQIDTPQNLYNKPVNLFVAGFIGSPAMNLVSARLEASNGETLVRFGSHGISLSQKALDQHKSVRDHIGKEIILGIRPENLEDVEFSHDREPGRSLDVTLGITEPLGSEVVAHFEIDAPPVQTKDVLDLAADVEGVDASQAQYALAGDKATFTARLHPRTRASDGRSMKLSVDSEGLYFFDPESGAALT
jgi:multiple sugar transport system ATP-binding protein